MTFVRKTVAFLMVLCMMIIMLCTSFVANAEKTNTNAIVKVSGECYYDEALEVCRLTNELRESRDAGELVVSEKLMEYAMQRAAEISIHFGHDRPDGTYCTTIGEEANGENIAYGYIDAASAVDGWTISSGHCENMLRESFVAMGAGVFEHNGKFFWVQVFSKTADDKMTVTPENKEQTFSVKLGKNTYDLSMIIPDTIYVTDKCEINFLGKNSGHTCEFVVNGSDFIFTSNNDKVLSFDGNTLSAIGTGKAKITAKNSSATITKEIEVVTFGGSNSNKCGDNIEWSYNNGVLTLTGSGAMYDYSTKYDHDTILSTNSLWSNGFNRVEKVVVSEGITHIGNSAFACFTDLKGVTLPQTLVSIGDDAFANCRALEQIDIPEKVTDIGDSVFYRCSTLSEVTLPQGVKEIGEKAFYSCANLESAALPKSVESIGDSAFSYCYKLSDIKIPQNVRSIGGYAFYDCYEIKEITIPYATHNIDSKAFYGCSKLSSVTISNPATIIKSKDVFEGVSKNLVVYGYEDSSAQKFCKDNGIKFVIMESGSLQVQAYGYTTTYNALPVEKDVTIDVLGGVEDYTVKYSKGSSFDYQACFDSIAQLSEYYRKGAESAQRIPGYLLNADTYPVTICVSKEGFDPQFVTVEIVVEKATPAFYFESSEVSFAWYSKGDNTAGFTNPLCNLADLTSTSVKYSTSDTSVMIVDWKGRVVAKKYGECTIYATYEEDSNHNAYTATFTAKAYPVGVVIIGDYTYEFFEDKPAAINRYLGKEKELTVENTALGIEIDNIAEKAFRACLADSVVIPEGIKEIGNSAFLSCYYLNSVTLTEGLEKIDDYAFSGCKKILSITIPQSVTYIGEQALGYTALDSNGESTKIEGFKIIGYKGTVAEAYALANGFEFEALKPAVSYELGDVDRDSVISVIDATAIQRHVARLDVFDEEQMLLGDFVGDGTVDVMDATAIQKKLVGKK